MSRILIAWELGANYGHITRQLPIAQILRAQGHEILFAVRDTNVAAQILAPLNIKFIQAPIATTSNRLLEPPVNYAEILIASGYGDTVQLNGLLQGWFNLIALYRPNLILIDHAPTALIAARIKHIPALPVGNGFEIPPQTAPLPSIRPWENIALSRLNHAEQYLLKKLNPLLVKEHGPPISQLTEIFQTKKVLATFAELDHYGTRLGEDYFGPLYTGVNSFTVQWQTDLPHLFAYIRPNTPGYSELHKALTTIKAEIIIVAPGLSLTQQKAQAKPTIRVYAQPVQIEPLLADTALSIVGGTGTICQCLLAGVPVLMVPQTIEQYLMSIRVEDMGSGIVMRQERKVSDFAGNLEKIQNQSHYRQAAQDFAFRNTAYDPLHTAERVVSIIDSILQKSSNR